MSNPFHCIPISPESPDKPDSISSFEYSDSDEFRDTIISFDFNNEFSSNQTNSIKNKIQGFRTSIESFRSSIQSKSENIEDLSTKLRKIEERISLKDLELERISENIHYYSTEIEESVKSIRNSKSIFRDSKESLSKVKRKCKNKVLEAETNCLVKTQELMALKEYLDSVKHSQEIGISEQKLKIQLANSRKQFALYQKTRLDPRIECNSLYMYFDSGLVRQCNTAFQEIIEKFLNKNKEILKSQLKIWTFNQIFHLTKMKILEDFQSQASQIRETVKRRLDQHKQETQNQNNELVEYIQASQDLSNSQNSTKSRLSFQINHLAKQLAALEKRIQHKKRQHRKHQKLIRQKTSELVSVELKLATLKSQLFILEF